MSELFADTFFFIALLNARDPAHEQAKRVLIGEPRRMVTSTWVLVELGDAFARAPERPRFAPFVEDLRREANMVIVSDPSLFDRGIGLYAARPDKLWSLTDCISFTVMQERGIQEALTGDRHFTQAGFRALLV